VENNNGALAFDVLIRDSNIEAMLSKDEQRIIEFKETTESSSNDIVSSFANIGKAVAGLAVTAMLKSWVTDIIEVRGQFQQLEIAFGTMLGSAEQAQSLMAQLTSTAASTPFDLQGIAQGAKQLLAYGESADTVNDTLVRLGNIASGLSIPLNDLVMLYGTTMVQGRLYTQDVRQFMGRGIPLVNELAKSMGKTATEINNMVTAGQIGFKEVQTVLENLTNEGGMFYGLMEEQSKSLTGQISNLEDAWDMMLNEIGTNMQGVLSGGISTVASLVENYDKCLKVLGTLAATYGTYKVALAAVAIAQNKSTGMTLIDNIALKARTALMGSLNTTNKLQVAQSGLLTTAQQAYNVELEKALTLEQQETVLRNLKTQALQALLTEQQALYLSRLQLTAGTVEYIAAAEAILTNDQREALAKQNLTRSSQQYTVAIEQTISAQQQQNAAQIAALRTEAATLKQKEATLLQEYRTSQNKIQQTRVQIALATQEGETEAAAMLTEQQHNQLKQHSNIISELKSTRLAKEAATQRIATLATQNASLAGKQKAASDTMQTATSGMLSTATTFLTAKLKALWATLVANPFTAIITAATTLISLFMMFGKQEDTNTKIAGEFNDAVSESYSKMNLWFSILKNSSAGTKEYNDALSKINAMCDEYHLTILKENSALDEQIAKHDELIEALERTTAAKIKAKYIEEEQTKLQDKQKEQLEDLISEAQSATYKRLEETSVYAGDIYTTAYNYVEHASENINNATDALWASVQLRAVQGSEELAKLTGEAYNTAHEKLISDIMQRIKETTGASGEELGAFREVVEKFVDKTIKDAQECSLHVALIEQQVSGMFDGNYLDPNDKLNDKIDITKLSLEELHKLAGQLNGSTITIECQTYGFDTALELLNAVKDEIDTQQNNLNTEKGISDEITRLKGLRESAELGSTEWKEYNKQITTLQAKLPKTGNAAASAAKKVADASKAIDQAIVDLGIEVEESKLDTIKDGFEKRQKELEAQHKKELARIDKEQKELEKKYKEAKKAMPQSVQNQFDELRNNENASYEIQQSELVSTEIEERKKQYERYYKWISTYGVNAANEQYSTLIEQGNTYTAWLEGKIQELRNKAQANGGLNEADSNAYVAYTDELNEVKGIKTEMDKFTESINKAKENSKTLGDYLTTLANKKLELQQGKGGLIGEDRAKAIQEVDKQITETTEELQRQLLQTYQTNAQLRLETERKYDQEITWLKQHGYTAQAEVAEKAKRKAIAEVEATRIQSTDSWKKLFADAQYLSSGAFDELVKSLRKQVEQIGDVDVKRQLSDQLDDLEKQITGSKNPFKLLVNSIKAYNAAVDGTTDKSKKFSKMFESIADSIDFVKEGFDNVVGGLKELGLAGDEVTQEMLEDVSKMMEGASQLAKGISTSNPMDILSGGISLITSALSLFDSTSRRIKKEMKQHEKQLTVLQRLYSQISWNVDNAVGEDYYTEQQKAIENLKKQQEEYEKLAELEQSKKSKDRDDDKVQEYLANAEQAARDIADIEQEITETLVQTNFKDLANDLADAWADAFSDMEDSAESFDEVWNETIANAVKNSLKLKLIEPIVSDFTNELATYMGAHNNSVEGFDFAKWKKMLQSAGEAFTEGLSGFEEYFQDLSDATDDASETLEGSIQGCSEDTASVVAGEMTTMRIRQMEMLVVGQGIQSSLQNVENNVKQALTYLSAINSNTGATNTHLQGIVTQLNDIKTTIASDPLRAKGYTS
jgi:tape measure domain-containing protein